MNAHTASWKILIRHWTSFNFIYICKIKKKKKKKKEESICNVKYVPLTRGNLMALLTYLWIICGSCNIMKLDSKGSDLIIKIKGTEYHKESKKLRKMLAQ